jgi:two-component system capsular synthesis response regulator RcsB
MFKKILVAEDSDTVSMAVRHALEKPGYELQHARYCDEAFLKVKKALSDQQPYDLLISDLSFLEDGRQDKLTSGEALIAAVQKIQPDIRVIVLSVEDSPYRIKSLFDQSAISAYVFKGRRSIQQLTQAMQTISANGDRYISPEVAHALNDKTISEIDSYDIELLKLLATGIKQEQIAMKLKERDLAPNSVSAVEKRINRLKIYFMAANNVQIVVKAIELGLIKPGS